MDMPTSSACYAFGLETSDPVCGCDGVTYNNDCRRRASGAPLDYRGRCVTPMPDAGPVDSGPPPARCIGFGATACAHGEVCDLRGCPPSSVAICVPTPTTCSGSGSPVCGCDGVTYASDCERQLSGFALAHAGACVGPAGATCSASAPCPAGQVCDLRSCAADATGTCVRRPADYADCTEIGRGACACGGRTYPNCCEMLVVPVAFDHDGVCTP